MTKINTLITTAFATATLSLPQPVHAQDPVQLELVPWASGLLFAIDITHCGDDRLFVARQNGIILVITDSMQVLSDPFLDISDHVLFNGERGLLGIAFDPDYASNGFFYVSYVTGTGNGTSRISRFQVSADPNLADYASEVVLFSWPQPLDIHKAGDLDFGLDGNLYISLGDGGGSGDPFNNAQDLTDPLGDILRITPDPTGTYSIPADNPFVGAGDTLPEIWASGFRNPYRFSIDRLTGDVWIADVGQESYEEINFWPTGDNSGPNFGWRCYEGDAVYDTTGCANSSSYVFPATTHPHAILGGTFCAIIGGRVYRGAAFPHLKGRYIYTDHCSGEFWTLLPDGSGGWVDQPALYSGMFGSSSIGDGVDGMLYATNLATGEVFKIVDHCPMDPLITQSGDSLISSPADSWQWYLGADPIPGATDQAYVPTVNGVYHVLATYPNGCVVGSESVDFISTGLAGSMVPVIGTYPDPAGTEWIARRPGAARNDWSAQVVDSGGRVVARAIWPASTDQFSLYVGSLPEGLYAIDFRDRDGARMYNTTFTVVH